ncbi:helix-turn-helix transcriptional regulator [Sanguibacter sp. HDW7]|uniref:helix-turn-helix domain-containing protein n=1 Tax=Sanguibacter sp. HDW7 TaxID=2714931 RepID=UPI0014087430|nr:helix-turn-helix transcriptional regulator [Sanguibacter sp. HDW7]QIK83020.1 helix-turn-helix transcriptional regulator [Sanguibacter sp. HDW7]
MPLDRLVFLPSIHHAGPVSERDWARLGREVVHARARTGLDTSKALADKMGVSARIVGEIENGRRESYSTTTIAKLEQALGWVEGSVSAVLAGSAPTSVRPAYVTEQVGRRKVAMYQLPVSVQEASDAELLAEIARRFARTAERDHREPVGGFDPELNRAPDRDDFDLVADDARGHDHETEDEDREIEP